MRHCFAVNMRAGASHPPSRLPARPEPAAAGDDARSQDAPEPSLSRASQRNSSDQLTVRYLHRGRTHYLADQPSYDRSQTVCRCSSIASRNVADLNRASITIVT